MQTTCINHGKVEGIKSQGYWTSGEVLCSICNPNGIKSSAEDIIEQQKIDADCNDCKHFKRRELIKSIEGLTGIIALGKSGQYFLGHCLKFDKDVKAFPVHYTGHECFKHRKE